MVQYCRKCGQELDDDAEFCDVCGFELNGSPQEKKQDTPYHINNKNEIGKTVTK